MQVIRDYLLPPPHGRLVRCALDATVLVDSVGQQAERPKLLVWRRGFQCPALVAAMRDPSWAVELTSGLRDGMGCGWQLRTVTDGDPVTDAGAVTRALRKASGMEGAPRSNVLSSIEIRDYEDRVSGLGGSVWLRDKARPRNDLASKFCSALLATLEGASSAGVTFYIEKVSIVLSLDASAPLASLTPTVHSDIYYGPRETGIFTVGSRGRGTWLFPQHSLLDFPDKPTTMASIQSIPNIHFAVEAQSGDVLSYDGQRDAEGIPDQVRGVPHISPDEPGRDARLVVLMRRTS